MKYFKNLGKQMSLYYAVESPSKLTVIIAQAVEGDTALNSYSIEKWDVKNNTADVLGVKAISTHEEMTAKEFTGVKKAAMDFIKTVEA